MTHTMRSTLSCLIQFLISSRSIFFFWVTFLYPNVRPFTPIHMFLAECGAKIMAMFALAVMHLEQPGISLACHYHYYLNKYYS